MRFNDLWKPCASPALDHALEHVRQVAAEAIGAENMHLVTIELVHEGDASEVKINGDESLVARIEAALDAVEGAPTPKALDPHSTITAAAPPGSLTLDPFKTIPGRPPTP